MSNHTPGPWSEFGPGNPQVYGGDPVQRICVLDWQTGAPMDECFANARLIAASPKLLESLLGAVEALDALTDKVDGTGFSESDEFNRALDAISLGRAAIAKATGVNQAH